MEPSVRWVVAAIAFISASLLVVDYHRSVVTAQANDLQVLRRRYNALARRSARSAPALRRSPAAAAGRHEHCGPWAGCVDRVAAAGDAVQAARKGGGLFATFGATSVMNGVFGALLLPTRARPASLSSAKSSHT